MSALYVSGLRCSDLVTYPLGRPEAKVDSDELETVVEVDTFQITQELAAKFDIQIPTVLTI